MDALSQGRRTTHSGVDLLHERPLMQTIREPDNRMTLSLCYGFEYHHRGNQANLSVIFGLSRSSYENAISDNSTQVFDACLPGRERDRFDRTRCCGFLP